MSKILNILVIVFTMEKAIQHLLTAVFFTFNIPGVGTPDIGPDFRIENNIMVILNTIYFLSFIIALIYYGKGLKWGLYLIILLAALDIILEFVFHGFFFITVSVIISILLIISCQWYKKELLRVKCAI